MNILNIIKELRLTLLAIVTLAASAGLNWEIVLPYVYEFNVHLMAIMALGFGFTYYFSMRGDSVLQSQISHTNGHIKSMLEDAEKSRIRTAVKQMYKDYHDIDEIDFETTQSYILDLEKQMIKAGVNSFSTRMINELKAKFVFR